jgi:radical SAM superfamily enzyme YgiQ (UPF0313 family)
MSKKKVLIYLGPAEFAVDYPRRKLRFSPIGGNIIATLLDPDKYEVDFYDIDAKLLKRFKHISTLVPYREARQEVIGYLKGGSSKAVDAVLKVTSELIGDKNYDFILNTMPCYGNSFDDCNLQAGFAVAIAKHLKKTSPNANVIMGGNWWDSQDMKFWKNNIMDLSTLVDAIVVGNVQKRGLNRLLELCAEKKNPWKRLLHRKEYQRLNQIKTFIKRESEKNLYSVREDSFRNREDLLYSYKEIFDFYDLPTPQNAVGTFKQGSLYFMEGCVGACGFCELGTTPVTLLPFQDVKDRIKYYVQDLGYTSLFFKNCAINPNRKVTEDFCNWLIKEKINITWSDSARFNGTDRDFFSMLYESGCRSLGWGCEAMSDRVLKFINKNTTADKIKEGARLSHEAGIWNIMNFIFAMPSETMEEAEKTISYIKENLEYMDEIHANTYLVKPNSPFYLHSKKYGLVKDEKEFNVYHPTDGSTSPEVMSRRTEMGRHLTNQIGRLPRVHWAISQTLLFPLYDILGSKQKVREWLLENYEPYSKGWGMYGYVF